MVNIENLMKNEKGIEEDELYHALDDLKVLLSAFNLKMLMDEWGRISDMLRPSSFTVAVVGDFSNGKSTFINQLLKKKILPTGDTPTTALLMKISYGPNQAIWWVKDGKKTELDFSQDSMDKITTNIDGSVPDGYVLIEVPDEWLQKTGIEIIDTPGIDNTTESKYELIKNLIYSSSATIIAVNSMRALSEKEREFVDDHVLSRKIPHIAIAITRLNQIPEKNRTRVIDYIRGKSGIWLKDMPTFIVNEMAVDRSAVTALGPEEIKKYLAEWESSVNNDSLKREQIKSQINYLLVNIKTRLSEMRAIALLQDAQKKELLNNARQKIMENKQNWEVLRAESDRMEQKCIERVTEGLFYNKSIISNKLIDEMFASSNLKEWYEKDFVVKMRLYVKDALFAVFDDRLDRYIEGDVEKLEILSRKLFSWQLNLKPGDVNADGAEYSFGVIRGNIKDLESSKVLINATGKLAAVGLNLLKLSKSISKKHPYLILIATAVEPLVEGFVQRAGGELAKREMEKQKKALAKAIPDLVEEQLGETLKPIRREIHSIYQDITNAIIKHESEWADFQLGELSKPDKDKEAYLRRIDDALSNVDRMLKSTMKEA